MEYGEAKEGYGVALETVYGGRGREKKKCLVHEARGNVPVGAAW